MKETIRELQKEVRGTFETLLLIFLTLKLTNLIDWSWWWVLSPIWIPACFAAVVILVYLIIFLRLKRKNKTLCQKLKSHIEE